MGSTSPSPISKPRTTVARLDSATEHADLVITATGNKDVVPLDHMRRWQVAGIREHGQESDSPAAPVSARGLRGARTIPPDTVFRVGRLIVIEGLDGAGKRTLADGIKAQLVARGRTVQRAAFPRYADDVHAELVAEALRGGHGDLGRSVHGMAVLYALDRRDAADGLRAQLADNDVVLLDRYVASNAAYGAARSGEDASGEFVEWVRWLEADRFAAPPPDLQILLRVPTQLAAERAAHRERSETGRERDSFESDASLQQRCGEVYAELAERGWWSPWVVVDGAGEVDFAALVDGEILR